MRDNAEKKDAARIREKEVLTSLGISGEHDEWKSVDLNDISGLDEFLLRAYRVITDKQQWESRIRELDSELMSQEAHSPDVLGEGIKTLTYWLQETQDQKRPAAWLIPVMVLIIIATGLTAVFAGWVWLSGLCTCRPCRMVRYCR